LHYTGGNVQRQPLCATSMMDNQHAVANHHTNTYYSTWLHMQH
jgi:hypothetical protein